MTERKNSIPFILPDWAPQPLPIQVTQEGGLFGEPLTATQVSNLRNIFGSNVLKQSQVPRWYVFLFGAIVHPFNILLGILATASGISREFDTMGIMLVMVAISAILRFHQEYKSQMAAQSLLTCVAKKASVQRLNSDGNVELLEIPVEELVPGDCIRLQPGDHIPADVVIYTSKDLYVSQASLTGEAIPVEKFPMRADNVDEFQKYYSNKFPDLSTATNSQLRLDLDERGRRTTSIAILIPPFKTPPRCKTLTNFFRSLFGLQIILDPSTSAQKPDVNLDTPNLCFMGTCVVSGNATVVVQHTGSNSFFGQMAEEIAKRRPPTPFQRGVRRVSWLFFITMAFLVPPVLLLQGFLKKDWKEAFLFALSVAVGLTPEMLPMIVNTTLAKGVRELSKKRCLVKTLDAIVNLGGIDVLCTDKTGTLTQSVVTVVKHFGLTGEFFYKFPLEFAYLTAVNQSSNSNPLDEAIIEFCGIGVNDADIELRERFTKIYEVPFDFGRRKVSVFFHLEEPSKDVFICKGAVDEIVSSCCSVWIPDGENASDFGNCPDKVLPRETDVKPLTTEIIEDIKAQNEMLNDNGLRVIAVAYKIMDLHLDGDDVPHVISKETECNLIFLGFIAFLDPPKDSTKEAIENLLKHNIEVKVLTGDTAAVCKKICEEINLRVGGIVTPADLLRANGSDEAMEELARNGTIFAKLTPLQKAEIVRALKRTGRIVGFLGDGINDAAALTEADVGISVDTGTNIAKESADIILLEKDLRVVVDGVVVGRTTYGNTLKYIVMAVSSNFGNVFSILVASVWLPFAPMQPIHILVQNLLYDISQIAIPWDHMDAEFLSKPHRWSMKSVLRFMIWMGPWSSVFDILTFAYMFYYFEIQTTKDKYKVSLFQTTWFTEGLLTQTLIVHMIRTAKIPFFQSLASLPVILMTLVIMSFGLALPYIPELSTRLQMVPLKPMVYPYVAGAIFAYCCVAQMAKVIYKCLFKEWF